MKNLLRIKMILAVVFLSTGCAFTQYQDVLNLNPVGYWPADEGSGEVLNDRSGNNNHGTICSVPWRDGYLDFENDVYQWIEVPYNAAFGSTSFSMGGYLYSGYDKAAQSQYKYGAILIGQPFIEKGGKYRWGSIWGDRTDTQGALLRYGNHITSSTSASERSRLQQLIFLEVASGTVNDVLSTAAAEMVVAHSQWQHLFYTYDASSGTGSVYLNGNMVSSADNIPFEPMTTPLVIGAGRWGTFNLGGNISLDGTLRHITYFDRVLSTQEVSTLYNVTLPQAQPSILPYSARGYERLSSEIILEPEIEEPFYSLPELIEQLQNEQLDELQRGKAALQLGAMGIDAKDALPELVAILNEMIETDGIYLPKVEEYFRNAVMKALLDIDQRDADAREILQEAYVKPFFEAIDTSQTYFDSIRPLIKSGKWFEALQAYQTHVNALPKLKKHNKWGSYDNITQIDEVSAIFPLGAEYFDTYLSKSIPYADAGYSAYNLVDNTRDGFSFMTMYERVPYDEVLLQYNENLSGLTTKEPDNNNRIWSRPKIIKMAPDGTREIAYLEGPWFIYDATDKKTDGWSIATDDKGYIHVWGGQHNSPNEDYYLPGIWPKLGMSEGEKAGVLYWVSKQPHDITDFEFLGKSNNPRRMQGWINYMNLTKSRSGQLYLYCRGHMWTWALHRYDSQKQRWTMINGSTANLMNHAQQRNPEWYANLGKTVPYYEPADGFVVAWQPGAYNFNRTWPRLGGDIVEGITFDPSGRMHVCLALLGVVKDGLVTHRPVYVYSDDLGDTFYSADGKKLELPLTHNPIPGHNADRTLEPAKSHFDVWSELIEMQVDENPVDDNPTDIEGVSRIENQLKVYPNPTTGIIHLQLGAAFSQDNCTIEIFNMVGNKVYNKYIEKSTGNDDVELSLNLNDLKPGIYLVVIRGKDCFGQTKIVFF